MTTRIGLISDIHASCAPLAEALDVLQEAGAELILCAGDIAGYGEELEQCVRLLADSGVRSVRGNHDLWYQRSPFFFLDRIQAPVQLICGAHDVRCPASESRQAYQKLIELGKDCEYHLYPDEGHSFLKAENQIKEKTQRTAFLARYLEKQ